MVILWPSEPIPTRNRCNVKTVNFIKEIYTCILYSILVDPIYKIYRTRVPSRNFSLGGGEANFHVHVKVISTAIVYLSMLTV